MHNGTTSNVPWRLRYKLFGQSIVNALDGFEKWGFPGRRQQSLSGWEGKAEQEEDLGKGGYGYANKRGRW